MGTLVLVRHGESRWNLSGRFTGWADVPLTKNGIEEAQRCAEQCKDYDFTTAYTSNLERAHETLLIILSRQNRTGVFQHAETGKYHKWTHLSNYYDGGDTPIYGHQCLNERFYGLLQGKSKQEAEKKYGTEKVLAWRRGYIERPPRGESLKDTFERTYPFIARTILPRVRRGEDILLVGHGNTLRGLIKRVENISDENIAFVDLPEAQPLVYTHKSGKLTRTAGEYHLDRPLR